MFLPLLLWLLIQMLVLALAVFEVRLSANFPRPAERAALAEMLLAQLAISALLMPWLLRRAATCVIVILCSVPFVLLAAFLSTELAWQKIVAECIAIGMWLAALACWRGALRGKNAALALASAIATSLVLAGPLLAYLQAEFSNSSGEFGGGFWQWSPFMAALKLQRYPASIASWGFFSLYLASGLAALAIRLFGSRIFKDATPISLHLV